MLKPGPRYKDKKSQPHHFFLDQKHPVKSEWDKFIFKDAKSKVFEHYDLTDDLLYVISNPSVQRRKKNY